MIWSHADKRNRDCMACGCRVKTVEAIVAVKDKSTPRKPPRQPKVRPWRPAIPPDKMDDYRTLMRAGYRASEAAAALGIETTAPVRTPPERSE